MLMEAGVQHLKKERNVHEKIYLFQQMRYIR